MSTREEWLALAERCERAKAPDYQVAAEIFMALRPVIDHPPYWVVFPDTGTIWAWSSPPPHPKGTGGVYRGPVDYMHSLDAITALIERELPGWMWRIQRCGVSAEAWIAPDLNNPACDPAIRANPERWHDYSERNEVELRPGSLDAAIIALCAAFCRAKAAMQKARPA